MGVTPCPMRLKFHAVPEIGRPSVYRFAAPRAAVIMPRVATNGGIRKTATRLPTMAPTSVPTASAASTDTKIGRAGRSRMKVLGPGGWAREAATTAARAAVAPTDRSMPLVMIAAIMPRPMMPMGATCTMTLRRFCSCRNRPSVMMPSRITKPSRMKTIEYFFRNSPKLKLERVVVAVSDIGVSFARGDLVAAGCQVHDGLLIGLLAG